MPDEPLGSPVLPGTLERRALGMKTEALDCLRNRGTEDRVVVVDQETMVRCIGEGFLHLSAHPRSRGPRGDIEGENPPPPVIECEPHVEQSEMNSGHDDEIHSPDHVSVITEKGAPALL